MLEYAQAIHDAEPRLPATYRAAAWYLYASAHEGHVPTNAELARAAGLKGGKRAGIRVRHVLRTRLFGGDKWGAGVSPLALLHAGPPGRRIVEEIGGDDAVTPSTGVTMARVLTTGHDDEPDAPSIDPV